MYILLLIQLVVNKSNFKKPGKHVYLVPPCVQYITMYIRRYGTCSLGQAYRHCYDVWDPTIDVSNCSSNQLTELEENAADLKQTLIANEEFNILTYLSDVQNVSKSTTSFIFTSQEQGPILPNDLSTTNNILDSIIWLVAY